MLYRSNQRWKVGRGITSLSSVRRTAKCDCSTNRMVSSFSEVNYLIPRPPIPDRAYLSRRFSSVKSAIRTFMSDTSRRRFLTSPLFAARAVYPAKPFFPASRNSFDQ